MCPLLTYVQAPFLLSLAFEVPIQVARKTVASSGLSAKAQPIVIDPSSKERSLQKKQTGTCGSDMITEEQICAKAKIPRSGSLVCCM